MFVWVKRVLLGSERGRTDMASTERFLIPHLSQIFFFFELVKIGEMLYRFIS